VDLTGDAGRLRYPYGAQLAPRGRCRDIGAAFARYSRSTRPKSRSGNWSLSFKAAVHPRPRRQGFSAGAHQFDSDITDGRHPRCALALTGDHLLALACDGRHADEAGLTLGELADALVALGARAAINLDGGGSASLVCHGELVNRPREQHGIELLEGRRIATALVLAAR
jgi:hypothetical protein